MTQPLQPPSELNEPLKLEVPEKAKKVEPNAASSMLPAIPEDRKTQISSQAVDLTKHISSMNPHSPDFDNIVKDVQSLAQKEINESSASGNALLSRKSTSVAGAKKSGKDATESVAMTLADLRSTVEELSPKNEELSKPKKFLGLIPGRKKITNYFRKYESSQSHLDAIVKSLMEGQDSLMRDNASLEQEKKNLWTVMGQLNEYVLLADELDKTISEEIQRLKNSGEIEKANKMDADLLFAVRQRKQDLMTQLAVSVQGYMAMDLIRKNNTELIKGVDQARTTTIFALRTAVITANALDNQKLVLDQIDALNSTTNSLIENTSAMLRQQTGRVHEQAVNSGVAVETLEKAFDNIFATIDEIDGFKREANIRMAETIDSLGEQLNRSRPYLERAHDQDMIEQQGSAGQIEQG